MPGDDLQCGNLYCRRPFASQEGRWIVLMKVLIVEDEPLIALSLAAELKGAGHEVLGPSGDPDEALCLAGEHRADIALIDLSVHGTSNGVELARALHATCDIPVLFLTTEPSVAHENADAALGVITFPFNPSDIPESLEAAEIVMHGGSPTPPSVPQSLELF